MQKFREAIQAYNVDISFVWGIHNQITDALSRAPVGGSEVIETVLRNWQSLFLPSLQPEPDIMEMVKARNRVRVGTMVTKDEEKKARPKLKVGEAVRGQDPKPYIWGNLTNCKKEDRLVKVGSMDQILHMSSLGNSTFKLCNSIKVSPNVHGVVLTCTITI